MEKRLKNIVLLISLALCAGLFVYFFMPKLMTKKVHTPNELEKEISSLEPSVDAGENFEKENVPQIHYWTKGNLAEEISKTAGFKEDETVKLCFTLPPESANFYISIQAEIFDDTGKSIGSYLSDEHNISLQNRENKEKLFEYDMNIPSMKNKLGIVAIRVFDAEKKESPVIYQLVVNFDGNKVWNNNLESRGVQ